MGQQDYTNQIMGCCFSGEEEAKATSIAAPGTLHGPINVFLKKQGLLDADYDVIDIASDAPWMLLDTVGGLLSKEMKYYIRHRLEDQEESTLLGAGVIRHSDNKFDYHITDKKREMEWDSDADVFSEDPDGARLFDEFDGDLKL